MKTKIQSLLWTALLTTGVLLTASVNAAPDDAATEKKPRQERPEGAPPAPRGGGIEQMAKRFDLTDAQVEQLKPILAAQREEVQALRAEGGPDADRKAMREKMNAIREKYSGQISAVLTPEQQEKWAKAQERRPGGQGGPDGEGRPEGKPRKNGAGGPPPPAE